MTQNLKEFFEKKTDRQLTEESIRQNTVINDKIDIVSKKVAFVFVVTLIQVIGAILFVVGAILQH